MFRYLLFLLVTQISPGECFFEGIYCGVDNCYDVLNLTRDASRDEITKSYRKLARKHHPDVHRGEEAKAEAASRFTKIAAAYEILKDDEQRKEYNYMLDNPEEVYRNYWYYYRRRYAPKVDVRIVVLITVLIISAVQYWASLNKYNEAIDFFLTVPKYRLKATQIAREEGLLDSIGAKKRDKSKTKEEIKAQEELILRKIIEEKMDIRGSYSKPTYRDVLGVQIFFVPYWICLFIFFHARWFYKFVILKEEYTDVEKLYLIRRNMSMSEAAFNSLDETERESYLALELWIKPKFQQWKREKEDEMKAKLAESSAYKRYRRWMKKGGPGQITFGED